MKAETWDKSWLQEHAHQRTMNNAWRGVETQYIAASLKLVNNLEEQALLEELLERSKPALPQGCENKHYLLSSPFRYFPQHSSRFRPANQSGSWYGASTLEGACSEVAYWRMRFILDSSDLVKQNSEIITEHTFFQANVEGLCINLMEQPWSDLSHLWKNSSDYSATHQLAAEAIAASIQWIQYDSVRAPSCALAVALSVDAMHGTPSSIEASRQEWICKATRDHVMMIQKAGNGRFEWHE